MRYDGIMSRGGLIWLGLVGCFAPHPSAGVPCDPALANCPSGQTCTAQAGGYFCSDEGGGQSDASVADLDGAVDGPPDDIDGDGVVNAADNCPAESNPTQADEDADTLGDACDPCPPLAANTDGDGDGVGDACDPHPAVDGDELVLFEGFADGIPSAWVNQGGWIAAGGDARIVSNDGLVAYLGPPFAPAAHSTATVAFVPETLHNATANGFGVANPIAMAGAAGISCQMLTGTLGQTRGGLVNLATGGVFDTRDMTWAVNQAMIATFVRADAQYDCVVANTTTPNTATTAYTGTVNATQPILAIRSRSVTGRARWLMYVKSP